MTTQEFIQANIGNVPVRDKWCSSVMQGTDGNFYSYGYHYPLLFNVAGVWLVNTRGYSNSTAKHINLAWSCADGGVSLASRQVDLSPEAIRTALKNELDEKLEELGGLVRKNTKREQGIKNDILEIKRVISLMTGRGDGERKDPASQNSSILKTTGMIALLGDVFGNTKKEKNDWKARMMKAGLEGKGLTMPEDWDDLTEDEKEKRLNGAIECIL